VPRVVLCAREAALEVSAIAEALRARGAEPVVLDSSAFPGGALVTLAYDGDGFRARWAGGSGDRGELHDISAVWQSVVVGAALPAMAPGSRETAVAAAELAVAGLLDSLQVFQLDPYWNKARADCKPYQLAVARRLGLDIPRTLVSNDPDAVRGFARAAGPVVTKMLVQPTGDGDTADGEADVVFTTALGDADLAQLDGLDLCPMIFQEQIDHRGDVRATVVGNRVFATALDRAARGGDELDWRRQGYAEDRAPVWAPYELPAAVADRLLRLLDHFGLNYGAADFLVARDGRHVFLELNASGSFAFLGAGHVAPIAAAIAEVLVDPGARRVPHG